MAGVGSLLLFGLLVAPNFFLVVLVLFQLLVFLGHSGRASFQGVLARLAAQAQD